MINEIKAKEFISRSYGCGGVGYRLGGISLARQMGKVAAKPRNISVLMTA